jgi:opacity protein-like surface antigen
MSFRIAGLLLSLSASGLAAQVGFPPDKSPYKDIPTNYGFSAYGGYLLGSRGRIGVGPSGGPIGGVRYEMSIGGPTDLVFGAGYAQLKRYVVDPNADTLTRTTGPVTQPAITADIGLNVLITGRKTWRRLAPYIGATLGMAFGTHVAQDTSGYNFDSKFVLGPQVGVRWYPTDNLTVRFEGRDLFWQIKYPSSFFADPARAPGQSPVLDTALDPSSEWIQHPTFLLSIGLAFR